MYLRPQFLVRWRKRGEYVSWDRESETCSRQVFAFEGIPVNSAEALEKAIIAKYGRVCRDLRKDQMELNRMILKL